MNDKIKKSAFVITGITLLCKIIGFFKNILLAKYWGTGAVVDAYVMVFAVGNIVFGWVGGFTGNFTPEYKRLIITTDKKKADGFADNLKNWLILITLLFVILFEIFAEPIIHIIAPGYKGEVYRLTVYFWKIYAISFFALVLYRLYKEYVNCNEKYEQAILPDLLMSSVSIIAIIISAYTQKEVLIWGYIMAIILEAVIEKWLAYRLGLRGRFILKFDDSIKTILLAVLPMFLSDTLVELNSFVDKIFASNLDAGTMAILEYANTIKNIAYETGVIAIVTIIYPKMSELWAKKKQDLFVNSIVQNIRFMSFVFIPITFGLIAVGKYLVAFIYQRGAFTESTTILTTNVLIMYSLGLLSMVVRLIINKVFCAMQQTRYVLFTSFINVIVNIAFNCILVKYFGMFGLAFSTSIAAVVSTLIAMLIIIKKFDVKIGKHIVEITKMICSGVIMLLIIIAMRRSWLDGVNLGIFTFFVQLVVGTMVGAFSYLILAYIFRIEEFIVLVENIKMRLKKRR